MLLMLQLLLLFLVAPHLLVLALLLLLLLFLMTLDSSHVGLLGLVVWGQIVLLFDSPQLPQRTSSLLMLISMVATTPLVLEAAVGSLGALALS